MQNVLARRAVALVLTSVFALTVQAEKTMTRADVEKIVEEYITNHPQVVIDSVNKLRERQQQEARARQREQILVNKAALFEDARDPVLGAAVNEADVTFVEFFDYNCGYCKRTMPELMKLVDEDRKVRVIMKEFPILSPESTMAAKYALAVKQVKPDAYVRYHRALMEMQGPKTEEMLVKLLGEVGVDPDTVNKMIDTPAIAKHLQDTQLLANRIGVSGTPTFIIGDELLASAMSKDTLLRRVTTLRNQATLQSKVDSALKDAGK